MYKLAYKTNQYSDDFYVVNIDNGLQKLSQLKFKLTAVSYAYKRLGIYWELDSCLLFKGEYKTFKQISVGWFKLDR